MSFDILIIGGGIIGLTAALAMAQRNYTVAVIAESSLNQEPLAQDLRVYAINQASCDLFKGLGVWSRFNAERLSPYRNMKVMDASNKAFIEFQAQQIAASHLGFIVEESILKQALLLHIADFPRIHLFPQCTVEDVQQEIECIRLLGSDRKTWEGQFLMIADGANSPMRQKLQIDLTSWSYHQNAIVANVITEKSHQDTAYQIFNAEGPLAFLPLASQNQCSIVWSTDEKRSQELIALGESAFNSEMTQLFSPWLGEIKLNSPRHQFPLCMRHVKQYVGDRWMILGDAAHTIHPLAGLGLNLGLADINSWMNYLDENLKTGISQKKLQAWQRERKHAVWQTIFLMQGLKQLFSHEFWPLNALRGWGLNRCNEIMPVKRLFMEYAAGNGERY